MAKRKRKRSKAGAIAERFIRPTSARQAHNDFRSAGAAMRLVPVIERLHRAGIITHEEYQALDYYRDQASLADKSPMKSCLDNTPGGGCGPGVALISAQMETNRLERGMGALRPLVRAVAVNDMTIEKWCIQNRGSDESGGSIQPHGHDVSTATMELKYAAGGIIPRGT